MGIITRSSSVPLILFVILLSSSVLYIFVKDNRKYAEFVEFIGLSIGAIFVILFFIGFIAIILTLFRPSDHQKKLKIIEVGEYAWQEK